MSGGAMPAAIRERVVEVPCARNTTVVETPQVKIVDLPCRQETGLIDRVMWKQNTPVQELRYQSPHVPAMSPAIPILRLTPPTVVQGSISSGSPGQVDLGGASATTSPPVASSLVQPLTGVPIPALRPTNAHPHRLSPFHLLMPENLVARIDRIVTDIECELADDLPRSRSPGKRMPSALAGETAVDRLDGQLWALERQREICDKRHLRLAELRRVVAEGQSEKFDDVLEPGVNNSEEHGARAGLHGPLKMSKLNMDHVASEKLRNANGLEQDTLHRHARALQEQLQEVEQVVEHERRSKLEAVEARSSAEMDLKTCEENSRQVLYDCRVLQAKVRDMQFGFEKERNALQGRIWTLEDRSRQGIPRSQHSPGPESELAEALASLRRCEQGHEEVVASHGHSEMHMNRITELEQRLLDAEAAVEHQNLRHDAHITQIVELEAELCEARDSAESYIEHNAIHRSRIEELERQLLCCTDAEKDHKQEHAIHLSRIKELERLVENGSGHFTRIQILEQQIGNSDAAVRSHEQQHRANRSRIGDLEQLISEFESRESDHARRHDVNLSRIADLERELSNHRRAGENESQLHATHRTSIIQLQQELADARATGDSHVQQNKSLRQRVVELEQHIADLELAGENHCRQQSTHRNRITELEQLLADAQDTVGGHVRQHGVLRKRINELEQELGDIKSSHESHIRQNTGHRKQIGELETQLSELQLGHDSHLREHNTQIMRIKELEESLLDARDALAKHRQQHTENRTRIVELEQLVNDGEAAESGHARQHSADRIRIVELEQRLGDREVADESRKRQHNTYQQRIRELEDERGQLRQTAEGHARQHQAHQARIAELEQRLEHDTVHIARITELEGTLASRLDEVKQHVHQHTMDATKIEGLERKLAETQFSGISQAEHVSAQRVKIAELEEHRGVDRQRITDLELELSEVRETMVLSSRQSEQELQKVRRSFQDQDAELVQRVEVLTRDLSSEKAITSSLRGELENMRSIELDAQTAMQKQDELLDKREHEWEEKLAQTMKRLRELEQRSPPPPPPTTTAGAGEVVASSSREYERNSASSELDRTILVASERDRSSIASAGLTEHRRSLAGSIHEHARLSGVRDILPGSSNSFVMKVRETVQVALSSLQNANSSHKLCIESQLGAASDARSGGLDPKQSMLDYPNRMTVELEQRTSRAKVEAVTHDLKALLEELEIEHELEQSDHDTVEHYIKNSIQMCEDELNLLGSPSTLSRLPEDVISALIDVHSGGLLVDRPWVNGLTPMHMATQCGRRDIITYLLQLDGGSAMLNARDEQGRTPLYYAHVSNNTALEHWLREEAGMTAAMHDQERRPSVSALPEQYQQLLRQIETTGWRSVTWVNGYTMLHWAAGKGYTDLCRHLIALDADINALDTHARTPVDVAKQSGHTNVAVALEDPQRASR